MLKRMPEGRAFGSRCWTYRLTDAQKQSRIDGPRRCVRTAVLVTIGFVIYPHRTLAPVAGRFAGAWLLLAPALVLVSFPKTLSSSGAA
jgi:hypothetical protein